MEPISRIAHDEAVRRFALSLVATGYEVKARVEGWFDLPDYINGYRPDIVAQSGNHCIIIEIKKGDIDWPKITALQQFVLHQEDCEMQVFSADDVFNFENFINNHGPK